MSIIIDIVAIGQHNQQAHKASHRSSKLQWRSYTMIALLLLVDATYMCLLFSARITFLVYHMFNTASTKWLQQVADPGNKVRRGDFSNN